MTFNKCEFATNANFLELVEVIWQIVVPNKSNDYNGTEFSRR